MYDLTILREEWAADFKATDPAFIDSRVQKLYEQWLSGKGITVMHNNSGQKTNASDAPTEENHKPVQLTLW